MSIDAKVIEGSLLIQCSESADEARVELDGSEMPGAFRWSPDRTSCSLPVPAEVFDGREHGFYVSVSAAGAERQYCFIHKSEYVSNLDVVNGHAIHGWVYDRTEPGRNIVLVLEIDNAYAGAFRADTPRPDVISAGHSAATPGFQITLPAARSYVHPRRIALRVEGTDFYPFGVYLTNINSAGYALHAQGWKKEGEGSRLLDSKIIVPRVLAAVRSGIPAGAAALPLDTAQLKGSHYDRTSLPVIDVVIPVYAGFEETKTCIESVIRSSRRVSSNIVVINDASPDIELTAFLGAHAADGTYTYLANGSNWGFVRTANRGMRLNPANDVVLLNADTVVSDGWLDRLFQAAYLDPKIATVTALSNNATICSLPRSGGAEGLPYGATLSEINAMCAAVNDGVVVDLPTAHGFCMFVKRAALDEAGLFDESKYGRGYGEENDLSLRLAALGWRNVAACDVFVEHKGKVSFQGDSELLTKINLGVLGRDFPDYHRQVMEFLRTDPMSGARNRVQKGFWRDRPCIVFITHKIGGGVGENMDSVAARLTAEGNRVLVVQRGQKGESEYILRAWKTDEALLYPQREDLPALLADILDLRPRFIQVHHVLDLDPAFASFLQDAGIPYAVTLHDYFYACPRVTLVDEGLNFCGVPPVQACALCVARGGIHESIDKSFERSAQDVEAWRSGWKTFLGTADKLIAPSRDTAQRYLEIFPDLNISLQPHEGPDTPAIEFEVAAQPEKITVAVIGAVGIHKGSALLLDIVRWAERWADDLRFVVIGFTDRDETLKRYGNVQITGPYGRDELPGRLDKAEAQVALFLSIWPETYSYTLSEALRQGLTPVALDIGAIAERIRSLGCGELVAPDATRELVVSAIRKAAAVRIRKGSYSEGRYESILRDYYAIDDGPGVLPEIMPLESFSGLHEDGWCERRVAAKFFVVPSTVRLAIELWVPARLAGQFVSMRINGDEVARKAIAADMLTTMRLDCSPQFNRLDVSLEFEFAAALSSVDTRKCAAVLRSFSVIGSKMDSIDGSGLPPDTVIPGATWTYSSH